MVQREVDQAAGFPAREEAAASQQRQDMESALEGRDDYFMDVDRMINEGLGGGYVSAQNGLIEETTTDTMLEPDSVNEADGSAAGSDAE